MSSHHPNHRLVKVYRTYTVEEIAQLFGKHKNTVRNWLREGLTVIDDRRPALVLGSTLVAFLKKRRGQNKQKLKPGEIYCVRCRVAVRPAGGMADCVQVTDTTGNLRGICPSCDLLIHRRVSLARIDAVIGNLEVTLERAGEHIRGRAVPSLNCGLSEGA
ncbi:MAG: helix-turn-helix domain-containing protein [Candidatus Glassbacteria bacterium]|nr:helix-turn-helix domain-containing protein [Candidatus Glassbacteria bacterium]